MTEALKYIIESLLMVTDTPLSIDRLREVLEIVELKEIRDAIKELEEEYETRKGGFFLTEVAGGFQLCTRPEYSEWVKRLTKPNPVRISKAALETLAIIAYKQPIIRNDVERVRGVDSGGVLRMLLERKLIRVLGRREIPGRPLIYATTKQFLELFNLRDLKDLPSPKEIESMGNIEIVAEDPLPLGTEEQDHFTPSEPDESIPQEETNRIKNDHLKSENPTPQDKDVIQDENNPEGIDDAVSLETFTQNESDLEKAEAPASEENKIQDGNIPEESGDILSHEIANQDESEEFKIQTFPGQVENEPDEADVFIQEKNTTAASQDFSDPIDGDLTEKEAPLTPEDLSGKKAFSTDTPDVLSDETNPAETGNPLEEAVSDEEKTLDLKEDKPI